MDLVAEQAHWLLVTFWFVVIKPVRWHHHVVEPAVKIWTGRLLKGSCDASDSVGIWLGLERLLLLLGLSQWNLGL